MRTCRHYKLNENKIQEIIDLYNNTNLSLEKIGSRLGISEWKVWKCIKISNTPKKSQKERGMISHRRLDVDSDMIVKLYQNGSSIEQVKQTLNLTSDIVIHRVLNERSIQKRPNKFYTADYLFFEKIDLPEKAYLLGWLFADGCNLTHGDGFTINLKIGDIEIVEKFKLYMKAAHPIKSIVKTGFSKCGYHQCLFSIHNAKVSQDLYNLGCVQAKSLILDWPKKLPENLIPFFIRGYFEGDGSLFNGIADKNGYVKYGIVIISSADFTIALQKVIEDRLGIKFGVRFHKNKKSMLLYSSHYKSIIKFFDWIYEGFPDLILRRKYHRYQQMKNNKGLLFIKYKDI